MYLVEFICICDAFVVLSESGVLSQRSLDSNLTAFGDHFGVFCFIIWGLFWYHLGIVLGWFWFIFDLIFYWFVLSSLTVR